MKLAPTMQINATDAALSAMPAIETLPRPSRVSLSFPQQRLWFQSRLEGGSEVRNIQIGLRLRGELNEAAMQSALDGLMARHEVLRTSFGMEDGEPFQQIGPADVGLPLKRDDLTAAADVEATLSELVRHEGQAAFHMEAWPLIRTRLVRLAEADHMLLITMHRMVSDDRSREIMIRELRELYAAAREGCVDRLTPLPVQYADYAIWQRRCLAGEILVRHSEYWLRMLDGAPSVLELPTDRLRPAQWDYSGSYVEFVVGRPLSAQLKALCRRDGATLFVTLLPGWALVLARLSGQNDLVIGTPSTNRARSEIEGLIGCFVHTLPLRIDLSGDPTLETLLARVNAATLGAQNHQDLPFERAVELVAPPGKPDQSPTFQPDTAVMNFIEGTRVVTEGELQASSIMRYQVTKFYREQITSSGYYEQLKYIVQPSFQEFNSPGNLDTSGEQDNTVVPGFQHKYAQTGLLLVTDRCASYCRYCLRKRMVGKDSDEIAADFAQIAQYIRGHPEITNVLLTGGDPFVLSTAKLDKMLDHLLPIPHLDSIRFGTKTLAYQPKRFEDPALPALFQRIHEAGKAAVIVTHFDHIGEISVKAEHNIRSLRAQGVQFLNQTVLLARVNDDPEILAATFAKCHQMGIRPYYLFQARPVKGASHFQVSLRRGIEIARRINQRLSGIQKTFKYIMSHHTGKIEILDLGADGRVYMRYHQNKSPEKIGKIFCRTYLEGACWLDDLPEG